MNFKKDIDQHLYDALKKNRINININDEKLAIHYFDIRERLIDFDIKFTVLKSKEITNILLSNILNSEEIVAFNDIVYRLENGISIDTYTSNYVYEICIEKSDYLLKNWGIYHLHLEKKDNNTNRFTKNNKLLFLKISKDYKKILLISIDKHPKSNTWYQEKWLKIIDDNWENELMCYPQKGKIINEISEQEMFKMSQKQIVAVTINDKIIFPFLGCATSGDSNINVKRMCDLYNFLRSFQEDVVKQIPQYYIEISKYCRKNGLNFNKRLDFHMIVEYHKPYSWFVLYEKNNLIKYKICRTKEITGFNL